MELEGAALEHLHLLEGEVKEDALLDPGMGGPVRLVAKQRRRRRDAEPPRIERGDDRVDRGGVSRLGKQ